MYFIHIIMSEEIEKKENRAYKHVSEKKKKSFSRKKILNMILFIIIVILFAFLGNRIARYFIIKRNYEILMRMDAKVKEDKKITNYYEKKNWDVDKVRETWRKDNNYLIKDTDNNGNVTYEYYVDGNYYALVESKDEVNNQSTKYAYVVRNIQVTPPNLGLQSDTDMSDSSVEEDFKKAATFTRVKSVKMEGIDCYQIYIRDGNSIYYMRKSDDRVIRDLRYIKEEDDSVVLADSGVIETSIDTVTDNDLALPDLSTYVMKDIEFEDLVEQQNVQEQVKQQVISAEENSNQ